MASNDSFKKIKLNKKDYSGKEKAVKIVQGTVGTLAFLSFAPKLLKGLTKLGKKIFHI